MVDIAFVSFENLVNVWYRAVLNVYFKVDAS